MMMSLHCSYLDNGKFEIFSVYREKRPLLIDKEAIQR